VRKKCIKTVRENVCEKWEAYKENLMRFLFLWIEDLLVGTGHTTYQNGEKKQYAQKDCPNYGRK